jgi:hypothetical protein
VFAVMVDGSVLCADCVHEATGDGAAPSAATIVHAWVEAAFGERCGWCGEAEPLDEIDAGGPDGGSRGL